jgi:exostosin family protein
MLRPRLEMAGGMPRICLVFLVGEGFDCSSIFERALKDLGCSVDTVRIPNRWIHSISAQYLNDLRAVIAEKSRDSFVIFSPQSTELFLRQADFTILYSAYRSWFDAKRMRVIPHLWTPIKPPQDASPLLWQGKPPLRIGFMGRDYTNSRVVNFIQKLPRALKKWLLRGRYLRYPGLVTFMNRCGVSAGPINAFARIETLDALFKRAREFPDIQLDIVTRERFGGSEDELSKFAAHLDRNTYILCPRGTENYSYRIYETLSRGRIPVIIDTDMVLPQEIDWDALSIRIPYDSLHRLQEIVMQDYTRSPADFAARQKAAMSAMEKLQSMRWVDVIAAELSAAAAARKPR